MKMRIVKLVLSLAVAFTATGCKLDVRTTDGARVGPNLPVSTAVVQP